MEIVKEGRATSPEVWQAEVVCETKDKYDSEGCGAVLKVTASDLVLRYWKGSHFDHYYTAVQCPRCSKHNRVKPPEPVWRPLHTEANYKKATFDGFSDR